MHMFELVSNFGNQMSLAEGLGTLHREPGPCREEVGWDWCYVWLWPAKGRSSTASFKVICAYLYQEASMHPSCDGAVECLYESMSSTVGAVLNIAIVFRAVQCAVRISQVKKRNYFSWSHTSLNETIRHFGGLTHP